MVPELKPPSHPCEIEAADPHTSPARLAILAQGNKPAHFRRRYVARNPSAPLELLLDLLSRHPADVLANPAWPLLCLELGNVWGRVRDLGQAASGPQVPPELIQECLRRNQYVRALLRNHALPLQTRRELLKHWEGNKTGDDAVLVHVLTKEEYLAYDWLRGGSQVPPYQTIRDLAALGPHFQRLVTQRSNVVGALRRGLTTGFGPRE